jgi:aldehyde dehydrogenase (NAD+)
MTAVDQNISQTFQQLCASQAARKMAPLSARKKALQRLLQGILDNEARIFLSLKNDLRRNRFETYACEIAAVKEEINIALKNLRDWTDKKIVPTPLVFQPGESFIEYTPKGVVLIIAPWNYPVQLSLIPLISAIAAGNCAILKPSELAQSSALFLADLIKEYLDPTCFAVFNGDLDTAKALLELPFDHIFYTGSTAVGREVMKKAAEKLIPVTLELGGKSPCLIDVSANLELAAKRIAWGKCLNAGQTCIAPDYVLIHESLTEKFIQLLSTAITGMYSENPGESPDYGRIINNKHWQRLRAYLDQGRIVHGGRHLEADLYIEPTLMVDVKPDAKIMVDEIFGPILPIISVSGMKQAVDFVNAREKPLALYIFANDKKVIAEISDTTNPGGLCINDCISHVANANLPFGGVGHSGMGSYHGFFGFETFSHRRGVYRRANFLDNPVKYPPVTKTKLALVRALI